LPSFYIGVLQRLFNGGSQNGVIASADLPKVLESAGMHAALLAVPFSLSGSFRLIQAHLPYSVALCFQMSFVSLYVWPEPLHAV
jgi:hypothetical protein